MPKNQQSETLSLPQLLQLAGIGQQPQQDSTREALSYMMGQQRLAADEADRKAKESQFQQDLELRRKALEQQMGQQTQSEKTARLHALTSWVNSMNPMSPMYVAANAALQSELGINNPSPTVSPDAAAAERNRLSLEEAQKRNTNFREATSAKNLGATVKDLTGFLHSPLRTSESVINNFGDFWGPTLDEFSSGFTGNPTGPEQAALTQAAITKHYSGLPTTNMPPLQLQGLASQLGSEVPQNILNGLTPVQMQELLKTITVAKPNQTLSFQP